MVGIRYSVIAPRPRLAYPAAMDDVIPLDDDSMERLGRFAAEIGKTPAQAAAILLRDLLFDDDFWNEAARPIGATAH